VEKKITIRLPGDVHAKIVDFAKNDMRSLNAEITVLLKEAIATREKK